jgi:hypothetical protein
MLNGWIVIFIIVANGNVDSRIVYSMCRRRIPHGSKNVYASVEMAAKIS